MLDSGAKEVKKWVDIDRQFLGEETHEEMLGFLCDQCCPLRQQQKTFGGRTGGMIKTEKNNNITVTSQFYRIVYSHIHTHANTNVQEKWKVYTLNYL